MENNKNNLIVMFALVLVSYYWLVVETCLMS